ncbi:hypothetical protein QBC37DRAFT_402883 [Rhypophila decipiens]|uniref:Uncharacterized protein n=1 Tax=Rhypophila decipiens TaxID=261697 RepID=A0AAN6Y1P5_9PEZI|nr:hypothetical protein QBC37DRAFT_402883 [Rhypophila decipiens]
MAQLPHVPAFAHTLSNASQTGPSAILQGQGSEWAFEHVFNLEKQRAQGLADAPPAPSEIRSATQQRRLFFMCLRIQVSQSLGLTMHVQISLPVSAEDVSVLDVGMSLYDLSGSARISRLPSRLRVQRRYSLGGSSGGPECDPLRNHSAFSGQSSHPKPQMPHPNRTSNRPIGSVLGPHHQWRLENERKGLIGFKKLLVPTTNVQPD